MEERDAGSRTSRGAGAPTGRGPRAPTPRIVALARTTLTAVAALCIAMTAAPGPARAQDALSGIRFDCVVEPAETLRLASPVAGILDQVHVRRGETVAAGQLVAELRSEPERAELRLAEARAASDARIMAAQVAVDLAEEEARRARDLLDRNIASQAQAQEAEAGLETARMELRLAELDQALDGLEVGRARAVLESRRIRSPIDGIVTERDRGPGEYVFQDSEVLTVARVDPLHVQVWLPVDLYPDVAERAEVHLRLEQPRDLGVTARVDIVDRVFDAASGTFGLRAVLDNPGGAIPGGQSCRMAFEAF